jgi:hypothetical protein
MRGRRRHLPVFSLCFGATTPPAPHDAGIPALSFPPLPFREQSADSSFFRWGGISEVDHVAPAQPAPTLKVALDALALKPGEQFVGLPRRDDHFSGDGVDGQDGSAEFAISTRVRSLRHVLALPWKEYGLLEDYGRQIDLLHRAVRSGRGLGHRRMDMKT